MPVKFVTGAILSEQYDPATNVFRWGARYRDDSDREYILAKFNNGSGNEAAAAGQFLAELDSAYGDYEGTNDLDDGDALLNSPLGQMQCAPSDGYGVWCQYEGPMKLAAVTNGTVAQDSAMVLNSATVGGLSAWSTGHRIPVGVAKAADVSTALAAGNARLCIPI